MRLCVSTCCLCGHHSSIFKARWCTLVLPLIFCTANHVSNKHLLSRRLHWILWPETCAQVTVQDKEEDFGFRSMETFCFSSSFPLEYTAPKSVLCCSSYQSWNWKVVPKIGKCHYSLTTVLTECWNENCDGTNLWLYYKVCRHMAAS